MEKTVYDVIIIGGGVSGLSALRTLHESGSKNILLLEANHEVGGRILSTVFEGSVVNLGAKWVVGSRNNEFFDKYVKGKLRYTETNYENILIYNNFDNTKPSKLYYPDIAEVVEQFIKIFTDPCSNTIDTNDCSVDALLSSNGYDSSTDFIKFIVEKLYIDMELGESSRNLSVKNVYPNFLHQTHGNDELFILDPFQDVIKDMVKGLESYVRTDQPVNNIIRYDDGLPWSVITNDNVYHATNIVYSCSLGVLKNHMDTFFTPKLSIAKQQAVSRLTMLNYQTIFVSFDKIYWDNDYELLCFFNNHNEYAYAINLSHANYNTNIHKPMLCMIFWDIKAQMFEYATDDYCKEYILNLLIKSLPKVHIDNVLVPRWKSKQYFQGAYTNWDFDFTYGHRDSLVEHENNIWFIGEHTSNTAGYIQGSYYSGKRAANAIHNNLFSKSP